MSTLMMAFGAYLLSSSPTRSTFFCSGSDRATLVVLLQWVGLFLDAAIIVLLWRILAWARTTKSRLRSLGTILLLVALGIGILLTASKISYGAGRRGIAVIPRGIDSLYTFDVAIDGAVISTLAISASLFLSESAPSSLVSPLVLVCGLLSGGHNLYDIGNFTDISRSKVLLPLYLLCIGFSMFLYLDRIRTVVFIHRAFIVLVLFGLLVAATVIAVLMPQTMGDHPLRSFIYEARIEQDRWLMRATVSKSLRIAVQEYKERHQGRNPPPGFDHWYKFATDRKSVIIDNFEQIRNDLLPFWNLKPATIREDIAMVASEPDITKLVIKGSSVSHNLTSGHLQKTVLDGLVEMIGSFKDHLPDMELLINLADRPRVLVPWAEIHGLTQRGTHVKSKPASGRAPESEAPKQASTTTPRISLSARQFRQMNAIACPPASAARSGAHWNTRDICLSCIKPQSKGQYLHDWLLSTDICHQSDLFRLHGFYATAPSHLPLQDLMPIFGRFKSTGFNDILIPLPGTGNGPVDAGLGFTMKDDRLFWRGKVEQSVLAHHLIHGGHQERLAHLANNASASDHVAMMLPTSPKKEKWAYESVKTSEVAGALRVDLGFSDYSACAGAGCERAKSEFGSKPPANPLENRYVLLPDTDAGPSPDILPTLRSASIPFIATIFREWYSERLTPWLHFVPIDLRYHALQSTLAYFTGLKGRGTINGRDPEMDAAVDDAAWIAEQGRKWAERAVRREDAEVYLFRLLLEWGRIIDDRRDDLGFKLEAK